MKLKKLIKKLDFLTHVVIWTNEDEDGPSYEGSLMDLPWYLLDYKIGRGKKNDDMSDEEPIYISYHMKTSPSGNQFVEPIMVINLIEK